MIHRTASIDSDARIEPGVQIGPYCHIGPGVLISAGSRLATHVVVERDTRIGRDCQVYSHAVIGSDPEDLRYQGQPSYLEIGDRTIIREFVTINRGCHGTAITRVGSDCLFMKGSHIGHDCQVGDHVILAALATLGGHIIVEDRVVIGGLAAMHQFIRIGTMAMVGGTAGVMQDVPPYCMVQGAPPATLRGLNIIGLRRNAVPPDSISALKHAFRLMFKRGMSRENALAEIEASVGRTLELANFIEFMSTPSKRGFCRAERIQALKVVSAEGQKQESDQAKAQSEPSSASGN